MRFKYLIIGILLIGAIILAGCVQKEVSVKELPACEFPRQIGEYKTAVSTTEEYPSFYEKGTHFYGNSVFVMADYGLTGVKILVYDTSEEAKTYFENSNYYSSKECKMTETGQVDCMVSSGKSTNDRSCSISGVNGRCVTIINPATGGSVIEFEWLEGTQVKSIKRTEKTQLSLDVFKPLVEHYKNCRVMRE